MVQQSHWRDQNFSWHQHHQQAAHRAQWPWLEVSLRSAFRWSEWAGRAVPHRPEGSCSAARNRLESSGSLYLSKNKGVAGKEREKERKRERKKERKKKKKRESESLIVGLKTKRSSQGKSQDKHAHNSSKIKTLRERSG